jgi:predicted  nucleic acid-binding Zn-ribbon protein
VIALGELAELNEADLRIDRIKADIAQIDEDLGAPPWLIALDAEIAAQQSLFDDVNTRRKDLEADLDDRREKIETEDAKLYDGSISEPRELRNQQEAIYAMRRGLKDAEDPAIASMEAEEVQLAARDYLTALKETATTAWSEAQADLQTKRTALEVGLTDAQSDIDSWRETLRASDLEIYDQHRRQRPLAIAAVIGGVCGACRVGLPTTLLTRARRAQEPVLCPTCYCIAFVP